MEVEHAMITVRKVDRGSVVYSVNLNLEIVKRIRPRVDRWNAGQCTLKHDNRVLAPKQNKVWDCNEDGQEFAA